jgi:hypothetical protein
MELPPNWRDPGIKLFHNIDEDGYDWGEDYNLDLGDGHWLRWTAQSDYVKQPNGTVTSKGVDDRGPIGAIVVHTRESAPHGYCVGAITFDVPWLHEGFRTRGSQSAALWQVQSFDPLTVSPSLLCKAPVYDENKQQIGECGDHGFIQNGRWVRA